MFNGEQHKTMLIRILNDIYSDVDLRTVLGFKGGTAALLFYDLPRYSVDLDFDLLQPERKELVFEKMQTLLKKSGELLDATEKHYTLFFVVRYKKGEHLIKIDISKRPSRGQYEIKQYLGISMLVIKQEDMTASKISALLTRNRFAARDVFDLWFFLKNDWPMNKEVVLEKTGLSVQNALTKAIEIVTALKQNQLLQGLGELLDEKQRTWARVNLQKELLFQLHLYLSTVK